MNGKKQNFEPEEIIFLKEMKEKMGKNYDEILKSERQDENKFIEAVKELMKFLLGGGKQKDNISSSQLRNIFTRVRKAKDPKQLHILRPKLAYVYGRPNTKQEMKKLLVLLDDLIQRVNNENQVIEFKNFFESIIAYHKFYGGGN